MANVKITDLGAYTNPVSTDVLPIVDVGADSTKKVSIADLLENAGSGTAAAPGIAFDGDSDTGIYRPGANQVAISTNGAERARIDSSGRLLVGTSTRSFTRPDAAIYLDSVASTPGYGNISLGYNGTNSFDQNRIQFYRTRGTTAGSVGIVNNGDRLGAISFSGADGANANNPAASIRAEVDGTPGTNVMPGRLLFSTSASGSNNPTERLRITSDAYVRLASATGGIQFNGDTAAANALDDYEEGTFTPAFSFATPGDLAVTYSNQVGNYRIVGKLCIATFTLEFTPTYTTSSGTARITGLPLSFGTYLTTPASVDRFSGFTLTAGYDNMWLRKNTSNNYVELYSMGRSGSTLMSTSQVVSGSAKILNGTIIYNL